MAKVTVQLSNNDIYVYGRNVTWNPFAAAYLLLHTSFSADGLTQIIFGGLRLPRKNDARSTALLYLTTTRTVGSHLSGPDFSSQMETRGTVTIVADDDTQVVFTAIGASDSSEPYEWIPDNIEEVNTFANHLATLFSKGLAVTFDDHRADAPEVHPTPASMQLKAASVVLTSIIPTVSRGIAPTSARMELKASSVLLTHIGDHEVNPTPARMQLKAAAIRLIHIGDHEVNPTPARMELKASAIKLASAISQEITPTPARIQLDAAKITLASSFPSFEVSTPLARMELKASAVRLTHIADIPIVPTPARMQLKAAAIRLTHIADIQIAPTSARMQLKAASISLESTKLSQEITPTSARMQLRASEIELTLIQFEVTMLLTRIVKLAILIDEFESKEDDILANPAQSVVIDGITYRFKNQIEYERKLKKLIDEHNFLVDVTPPPRIITNTVF